MNKHLQHKDQHTEFFSNVEISYSKSKDDVWKEMMEKAAKNKPTKTRNLSPIYFAVAATLLLIIGLSIFIRFYSRDISCPKGQHMSINLPDESKVQINANSNIKYYPYWWNFARIVDLQGEAFFEVEPGNSFRVKSKHGTTTVLGTSFNIYAREDTYEVHCVTGKVNVSPSFGESKIIHPNQKVLVNTSTGMIEKRNVANAKHSIAWTKNQFIFTSSPLKEVYKEMERQFNIEIEIDQDISGNYTGNFKRGSSSIQTLKTISKPFGLKVIKQSNRKYKIEKTTN